MALSLACPQETRPRRLTVEGSNGCSADWPKTSASLSRLVLSLWAANSGASAERTGTVWWAASGLPSCSPGFPLDVPDDLESDGHDLGVESGCNAVFEENGIDTLYHGSDEFTAEDCTAHA